MNRTLFLLILYFIYVFLLLCNSIYFNNKWYDGKRNKLCPMKTPNIATSWAALYIWYDILRLCIDKSVQKNQNKPKQFFWTLNGWTIFGVGFLELCLSMMDTFHYKSCDPYLFFVIDSDDEKLDELKRKLLYFQNKYYGPLE